MQQGGLILYPTDTIWGIGCDATNEEAVRKVYDLKKRADNKAMLVLMDNPAKLETYVEDVPEVAWSLIEVADKPLTLIYSKGKNLAPNLLGEDGSIGIRISQETFANRWFQLRPMLAENLRLLISVKFQKKSNRELIIL